MNYKELFDDTEFNEYISQFLYKKVNKINGDIFYCSRDTIPKEEKDFIFIENKILDVAKEKLIDEEFKKFCEEYIEIEYDEYLKIKNQFKMYKHSRQYIEDLKKYHNDPYYGYSYESGNYIKSEYLRIKEHKKPKIISL